jgi:diacylglycerol kinase
MSAPPTLPDAAREPRAPAPGVRERRAPTLGPRRLARSFAAAFAGLAYLLRHEANARIHVALAGAAALLGLWLGLAPVEWALLATLYGLVIGLEALNSAVERLADLACPELDPRVQAIKDLAAAGVLVAALGAAGAGLAIFGPRLLRLFAS